MKKVLISLLVLAFCAPAMAATTIDAVGGAGTITVTVTVSEDDEVRGLAVAVEQTDGDAVLNAGSDVSAPDFNTYIDFAKSYPTGYDVGMTGQHAAARIDEAGAIDDPAGTGGDLTPAADFSVSVGYLDQTENQLGLDATGGAGSDGVYTITITLTGTVTSHFDVSLDTLRGGIVGDDLETSGNVVTGTNVEVTFGSAYCGTGTETAAFKEQWDLVTGLMGAEPTSWCNARQCFGDADNGVYGKSNYYCAQPDLDILLDAWSKPADHADLTADPTLISADFDRLPYGKSNYRVAQPDLDILIANWSISNDTTPPPACALDTGRQVNPNEH